VPLPRLRFPDSSQVEAGFGRIRERLDVPERFPPAVEAAAAEVVRPGVAASDPVRADRRDLELVTIDPPGSKDLDQAFHAERRPGGHRVHYAIADVGAFVRPGSPLAAEAWERGVTLYSPGHRASLHPDAVGEGAASLLAGQDRPAVLWTIDMDDDGAVADVAVERALVRSRAQLTYRQVQGQVDSGGASPSLGLLKPIGEARRERLRARGGISLHLPDQEVVAGDDGYRLVYDAPLPVEQWNEQISLLAGMAAAAVMLDAGFGLLRTLPRPGTGTVRRLGHSARALNVPWSDDATEYAAILERLDPARPADAALITASARLFRGASYEPFVGSPPADPVHHAIGGPYTHVTAPLRRLVDRYTNELVLAASAGDPAPEWVVAGLEELPSTMNRARQHQGRLDRASVDFMESMVLAGREGEEFRAVVTAVDDDGDATVQLTEPAVIARVETLGVDAGEDVVLRLDAVDTDAGTVRFVASR
jgi:exoribonuclease R